MKVLHAWTSLRSFRGCTGHKCFQGDQDPEALGAAEDARGMPGGPAAPQVQSPGHARLHGPRVFLFFAREKAPQSSFFPRHCLWFSRLFDVFCIVFQWFSRLFICFQRFLTFLHSFSYVFLGFSRLFMCFLQRFC